MASLWDNIFRPKPRTSKHALLRRVPMFADLDRRELIEVEKILYRRSYEAGEVIFRQDDPGVGMYVIERGRVEVVHDATGRRLAELGDGDFFGEIALLNETPRSARVAAIEPTTLYGLFQPELYDLFERMPRLGVKLLHSLAQMLGTRLLHADEEVNDLHEEVERLREAHDSRSGRMERSDSEFASEATHATLD
jgi:CRP-like cAMP-binding protein